MKIAIFSDVHSTPKTLIKVLSDITRIGAEKIVCLGDIVGYGKDPESVVGLLMKHGVQSIMGNHDMALFDDNYLDEFQSSIRKTILQNRKKLSDRSKEYLKCLKPFFLFQDLHFVHGTPPDQITTYLYNANTKFLKSLFIHGKSRVYFTGHTHKMEIVSFDGKTVTRTPVKKHGRVNLHSEKKYIINVGSVVLPRDGIGKSKYAVMDTETNTVDLRMI